MDLMDLIYIFWKPKTPAELLRETLDKSAHEIERERQGLQTQEKKLIAEIKKSAKQGQMGVVKIMAKDVIRTRHQLEVFYKLKSQLQGISLRIQMLKSTQAVEEVMKEVTKAVGQMNGQMNLPSVEKIQQDLEKQNNSMPLTSDVQGDAIDDALKVDEKENEIDELVNQILNEIGISVNQELVNAPSSAVAVPAAKNSKVPQAEATSEDDCGIDVAGASEPRKKRKREETRPTDLSTILKRMDTLDKRMDRQDKTMKKMMKLISGLSERSQLKSLEAEKLYELEKRLAERKFSAASLLRGSFEMKKKAY